MSSGEERNGWKQGGLYVNCLPAYVSLCARVFSWRFLRSSTKSAIDKASCRELVFIIRRRRALVDSVLSALMWKRIEKLAFWNIMRIM